MFARNKHNVKVIWQHIRSFKGDENNLPIHDNVDEFNNFYADLGPNTVCNVIGIGDYGNNVAHNVHTFVLKKTNINEVLSVCGNLKSKLSAGIDGMLIKLLQREIEVISLPLTFIINLSFNTRIFPNMLKITKMVLIFKGGDHTKLINYKPVSVLPAISKIFEKLMYERIISFACKYSLLTTQQYGFRSGISTQDAVANLVEHVTMKLDQCCDVSALYIDVSKAFDSVNYDILLYKLYKYDYRDCVYDWLSSYLRRRMQYVEFNSRKSMMRILCTRIPQVLM